MLGYDDEQELLGQSIHEMIHHSYADGSHYPKEECTVRKSALANESGHSVDEVHWRRDGSSFPVEYWSHPIYREGEVVGTVVTFVDITERLQVQQELKLHRHSLEKQVRQRTRELAATNRELEAFSYSVSHDLRAPLRAIDGFSQALLEDYHDRLDDTGRDYLRRVRKGSKRMGLLIDEILQLSRVTRTSFVRKEVDLSRLANDVIDRLRSHEPERRVKVEIDQGLICHGDESLLEILLENLLNNAWKYSANEACSLIKFSSYRDSDRVVYYIEDNGAGFDMNYSQGLFKAFQRMHSEAEFPGTGIGLASVQRIVNRHGGKVWAQAEEDRGATFYFTVEEN